MKAIAKCPKCGEVITTDCKACIEGNTYACPCEGDKIHECDKSGKPIENVKWKKIPTNEDELIDSEMI